MSNFYRTIKLEDDIYRITSAENVFIELIVGKDKAMLIDTGYGFGDIKKTVREITDKPLIIFNTHGHLDHVCGNFRFEEPAFISKEDMPLALEHTSKEQRTSAAEDAKEVIDYGTGRKISGLPDDFNREEYINAPAGDYIETKDGEIFDIGGYTFEVVATPGHTKGSLSLLLKEKNWLYVGDAANGFLWLFMPDATDRQTYVSTLDKLIKLNPIKIWGGHAPFPMDNTHLERFRKTALEADFDKGIPFQMPFSNFRLTEEPRICLMEGCTMNQLGQPDFAAIVLAKSKL
ncbi:MAG: MBL fold metallo-hydrolase [Lachnospiraceae bacterium]|nr:MBL fold metallo-hydrolase [Lachnospiraceae bacterium]